MFESTTSSQETYKLSQYNYYIKGTDDRVLIYNALSRVTAAVNSDEWERLKTVHRTREADDSAELMEQALSARFLLAADLNETRLFQTMHRQARFADGAMTLTIAPTLNCNFGCDYCYQSHDKPSGRMTAKVQDALVDWVASQAPRLKSLGIAWYGGEPTMAWSVIRNLTKRLLAVCEEHRLSYSAMMVTNGFNLSPAKVKELADLKISSIQITLDGPPEIHDTRRHTVNHKPTFWKIVTNIKKAVKLTDAQFAIRVNIDERNRDTIDKLITILGVEGITLENKCGTYFAPVDANTPATEPASEFLLKRRDYADLESNLYDLAMEAKISGSQYPGGWNPGSCAAVKQDGWVIVPNGDLFKCWDEVSYADRAVGNIMDKEQNKYPNPTMQRWLTWEFADACLSCKVLPLCVGGCPLKTVRRTENDQAGLTPCLSYRFNVRDRIRKFAAAKGVLNGPPMPEDLPIMDAECGVG